MVTKEQEQLARDLFVRSSHQNGAQSIGSVAASKENIGEQLTLIYLQGQPFRWNIRHDGV